MTPKVSVIVCHHTGKLVLDAIETIRASKLVNVELILLTDDKDIIVHGVDRLIWSTQLPAAKRNIGVKFASSKYLAFFDDDVQVNSNTISEMLKVLTQEGVGMVFGKSLNMEHRRRFDEAGGFLTSTGFIWARAESGVEDIGQFNTVEPIFAGKSATCMVTREAFWRAGGFDDSFGILGEESDLAWRVWLKGYKVMWCPKSVTYHAFNTKYKPVENFYTNERIYLNGCRNYLHMLLKNAPVRMLLVALPAQLFAWLLAAVGHMLVGRHRASLLILQGIGAFFARSPSILWQRKEVRSDICGQEQDILKQIMRNPSPSYYLKRLRSYIVRGTHG